MQYISVRRWALCLPALIWLLVGCIRPPDTTVPHQPTALEHTLLGAWTAGEGRVLLDTPTPLETVEATYFALLERAPEFFWVADRFSYTAVRQGVIAVDPIYLCAPGELPAFRSAFVDAVGQLLAVLPPQGSDYARAYALHDALAAVAEYGRAVDSPLGADGAYTAYGALVDGTAVCRGYAMAYLTMLGRAGIAAEYIHSDEMSHGWVRARLDGRWYHIDVTWNDREPISHRSFARTDAAMVALGYAGWE